MLEQKYLDEIRARAEAATPGPWKYDLCDWGKRTSCAVRHGGHLIIGFDGGLRENDASFIAHARNDIPSLLAEVERLSKENEMLEGADIAMEAMMAELERLRAEKTEPTP